MTRDEVVRSVQPQFRRNLQTLQFDSNADKWAEEINSSAEGYSLKIDFTLVPPVQSPKRLVVTRIEMSLAPDAVVTSDGLKAFDKAVQDKYGEPTLEKQVIDAPGLAEKERWCGGRFDHWVCDREIAQIRETHRYQEKAWFENPQVSNGVVSCGSCVAYLLERVPVGSTLGGPSLIMEDRSKYGLEHKYQEDQKKVQNAPPL
jgi:hypothetical protein